jgi:hypothetical protein
MILSLPFWLLIISPYVFLLVCCSILFCIYRPTRIIVIEVAHDLDSHDAVTERVPVAQRMK